jgi:hypothetical protein
MTTDKIKQRLSKYLAEYQENAAHIKGTDVIFEYINFLKTEPYTKKLLAEEFKYAQTQKELLEAYKPEKEIPAKDLLTKPLEIKEHSAMVVINKDLLELGLKQRENHEHATMKQVLPMMFTNLVLLYEGIKATKEKVANNEPIDDVVDILKDFATATFQVKFHEEPIVKESTFNIFKNSLFITNKYIFDSIDSKEIFGSKKTKKEPWFDKDESILHFWGEDIKIKQKSDKPIDHYVLEAIFSKKDLTEQTDYVEIAEDFRKDEYNGKWNRFRNAIERLNKKIAKATNNEINDFIIKHDGITGWCKINQKYL